MKLRKVLFTSLAIVAVTMGSVFADGIQPRNNIPERSFSGASLSTHSPQVYMSGKHTVYTKNGANSWKIKLKEVISWQPDPVIALVTNKTNPTVTKTLSEGDYYIEYEGSTSSSKVTAGTRH